MSFDTGEERGKASGGYEPALKYISASKSKQNRAGLMEEQGNVRWGKLRAAKEMGPSLPPCHKAALPHIPEFHSSH